MALRPTAVTHPHPPCAGAGVCYRCGRARWRKHLFRRPRWALLLGRGRPDPRGMPRGWATWLPPHAPAHVLSHLWPAARAKAPSRARRSAAQLAWEAAAAQRCRAPTGELVGRWPLAEAGSGGACPAKARRAARELLLSSATVVQGSALQAGSGAERASEPPCDVQHSGDCCVAASKTASWVPRAGRAARPAVAAADWTRHCHACGCAAPAFYHAWHCHARSPQSEWCRHQPPFVLSPQPSMRRREQLVDVAWMPTPQMPQRSRRTRHQRQPPAPRATLPPLIPTTREGCRGVHLMHVCNANPPVDHNSLVEKARK